MKGMNHLERRAVYKYKVNILGHLGLELLVSRETG